MSYNIPMPRITPREVIQRAQRHVGDSTTTLRWTPCQEIGTVLYREYRYS